MTATIYCDGACKGNPGPGGWGCYVRYDFGTRSDDIHTPSIWSKYGGEIDTTNNRMELMAIIESLKLVRKGIEITIFMDTSYGLNGIIKGKEGSLTKKGVFPGWLGNWLKKDWKTANGAPVKNKDLWEAIIDICGIHIDAGSKLKFKWIKGHSGNEGNDKADELANLGVDYIRR
jgi:ribonuclease HI